TMAPSCLVPAPLQLFLLLGTAASLVVALNNRPVIGIVGQKPSDSMLSGLDDKNYTSYIAASYVKYLESAGARVVPILTHQDDDYYTTIADSINGILLPGGGVSITSSSGYGYAADFLYEKVLSKWESGVTLPLWGTCLGFETLTYLLAGRHRWLTLCSAENKVDPLLLEENFEDSYLFQDMPNNVLEDLIYENTTINFHRWCMTRENFTASGLIDDVKLLSTNVDYNGLEFVSTMEHKELPIYGVQWHPEKNPFEWADDDNHINIPHSPAAIRVAQYFANKFVLKARENDQSFSSLEEENTHLIYNHEPFYVHGWSSFMQIYLFR
ncbi:unnamed protein product, partial [Meganyctiphanes norvegica]